MKKEIEWDTGYRRSHFAHHREEFGPNEPDMNLYVGYPITRASFRRKLRRDAVGVSGWKNLRALLGSPHLGNLADLDLSICTLGPQGAKLLAESLLQGLSLYELRVLRNEIYARHGRTFRSPWLSQYFFSQPWYAPVDQFSYDQLTGTDKQNVETIVKYENRLHEELSTKPVTQNLLKGLFLEDAAKMRQEILARRGKVFKEAWLQQYFSSFDWYKADPNFTDASLSEVEKQNINTIVAYEKKAVSEASVIEG